MKTFKLSFFSLLAVFAFSTFITSCKSDMIETKDISELNSEDVPNSSYMYLPKGYNFLSEDEINEYIVNLTENEKEKLHKNYLTAAYLESISKKESIEDNMKDGETFEDIELSDHLDGQELAEQNAFKVEDIATPRGCWPVFIQTGYYPQWGICIVQITRCCLEGNGTPTCNVLYHAVIQC